MNNELIERIDFCLTHIALGLTVTHILEECKATLSQQQEVVEKNQTRHTLYEDSDENIPEIIQDRNGQVSLSMCKICGAAESELNDFSYCESYLKGQQQEAKPVAVIGDTFSILWIGRGPIAPIIERNGLKVGDKLYAHPPKPAAQPQVPDATFVNGETIDRMKAIIADDAWAASFQTMGQYRSAILKILNT